MKGTNVLTMNQAEMMRAIEYYLNQVQFKEPVRITKVSENKSNFVFDIELEESKEGNLGSKIS